MSDPSSPPDLERKLTQLERLHRIGLALGSERDRRRLIERILEEAKELCNADGGTLYLRTDEDTLRFVVIRNDSLGIRRSIRDGVPIDLEDIPLYDPETEAPNHRNVASHCALVKTSVNIEDAYDAEGFDFSGTERFDRQSGYRSKSFLTIPMLNQEDDVIGVLQLINCRNERGETTPFGRDEQEVVEALASQAGVALDNLVLLFMQKRLMESFIKLIAAAIDDKSPYTGGHCRRVPVLTEMLAEKAVAATEGPFSDFALDEDQWYELRIAAWLHDCGKVTTPVHVMDKATKLETISDRIETVRARFEIIKRDAEIEGLRKLTSGTSPSEEVQSELSATLDELEAERQLIESVNVGGEFLSPEAKQRVERIAERTWKDAQGVVRPLLTEEEVHNLTISRGTLTDEERIVINGHMVQTIRMLESLPFPRNLSRVPEYAGGHHEKMDGTGYPRGIFAGDMSIPARIMAIADVFEALTAQDRPYKKAKTLSETMSIMGKMKEHNHLDPDLFDLFVTSGVWRDYAQQFMPHDLIDEVDEAALLAIRPKPFELPGDELRKGRWQGFLSEYQVLLRDLDVEVSPRSSLAPPPPLAGREKS